MKDFKEELLRSIGFILLKHGANPDAAVRVKNDILMELDKYDIMEKCTALATIDTVSENLIKLYAGSILTEGKSKKTVKTYTWFLLKFMCEIDIPLTDVSVFDLRVWLAGVQRMASARTAENYRSYLSAFYIWLTNEEFIPKNPMAKIKPIKYPYEAKQPFTDIDMDAMRSACTTLRERAELEMLLTCGARVSELAALNREDVDMNQLKVYIREGKGGKYRETYINDVCRVHLEKYLETRYDDNPALFVSRNKTRMSKGSIEGDMKRIGKKAGVSNVHPHRCRRTFATGLAKKGMDVATIQKLMGHTDLNTTMTYIALSSDKVHSEYRRFN